MGYETKYSLKVNYAPQGVIGQEVESYYPEYDAIVEYISLVSKYDDPVDGHPCKWYDHEKDMLKVSKKFPELLFTLSGIGEAPRDLWMQYFHNGKSQLVEAKITYDDFDASKLI